VPHDVESVHGLPVQGFAVDLSSYGIVCRSDDEAHYLAAVLNSDAVNDAITHHQTRGEQGPRDIHRRPVQHVPIPMFSENDLQHQRLTELSRSAHELAVEIDFDSSRRRRRYLDAIGSAVKEINDLAVAILDQAYGRPLRKLNNGR